jgi:hypothetical protein
MDSGKWEKAYLSVQDPTTDLLSLVAGGPTIEFSFNPKEFTISQDAAWSTTVSKAGTLPEFSGTKAAKVTLEMFLDASEGGSITGTIDQLFSCVAPAESTLLDSPSPPFVTFGWGESVYMPVALVKSVSVRYSRFSADGTPIRAIATVALEEIVPPKPWQNPTSRATQIRASRTLQMGDTLASVAHRELGTPGQWRQIARASRIVDPFRVRPGRQVVVPSSPEPSEAR